MKSMLSRLRFLLFTAFIFIAASVMKAEMGKPLLHVRVDVQGEIVVSDHKATVDQLSETVAAFLKEHPDAIVEIGAAKNMPVDKLAKIYDACRRAGASKFTIPKS